MRHAWRILFILVCLAAAGRVPAQGFDVARLDGDPVAASVLSGALAGDFVPVDGGRSPALVERDLGIGWWRITARDDVAATGAPQLLLNSPYLNRAEVWRPGDVMPLQRAVVGANSDPSFSARALFVPLPRGLRAGESVYVRLHSLTPSRMPVSVESLDEAHRRDLVYVGWRTGVLSTLLVLVVLTFGFWVGMGERAYAYLMVALACQVLYQGAMVGDLRIFPALAGLVGGDPRIARIFGLASLIASNGFLGYFLGLASRQRTLYRTIQACNGMAVLLVVASLVSMSAWVPRLGNVAVLVSVLASLAAAIIGTARRQRAARFLLVSWLPLMVMVGLWVCDLLGLWQSPYWLAYAYPAAFAISGLIVTIGLSDKMHELRRDRDEASRMASYDALTGTSSRQVIEEQLKGAVADAHRTGLPLSVVFFDIDHFKRINDRHGHRIGDECLKLVAMRTCNRLRTYDQIGRYGGDEMIVILPDTGLQEGIGVAENLRSAVNCRPISIEDQSLDVTLSLGVAQLAKGESAAQLLERADAALYASKSAGRDRVTGHIRPMFAESRVNA